MCENVFSRFAKVCPKGTQHMPHCNHTKTFGFLKLTSEAVQVLLVLFLL
jgi:hypothetical protein